MISVRRRWLYKNAVLFFLYGGLFTILRNTLRPTVLRQHLPDVPELTFDYGQSPYNESKVALLIENRASGMLAPLLMHFMAVVPPDWKFRFLGSPASVAKIFDSAAVRAQVETGKLEWGYIPTNMTTSGQEQISAFLTNRWVIEHVLEPAEWLLLFQTDSMLCGNHPGTLDDWLEYSWVGAPWYLHSRYGGNGGLSLRRVSAMLKVLQFQTRQDQSEPEDVWLTERIGHLPGAKTANGTESVRFSVEAFWYDEPLGYHIGGSGEWLNADIWGSPEHRDHVWSYCPEIKMTLDMDVDWAFEEDDLCNERF